MSATDYLTAAMEGLRRLAETQTDAIDRVAAALTGRAVSGPVHREGTRARVLIAGSSRHCLPF